MSDDPDATLIQPRRAAPTPAAPPSAEPDPLAAVLAATAEASAQVAGAAPAPAAPPPLDAAAPEAAPAAWRLPPGPSPLERLAREPTRFDLDQAAAVLAHARGEARGDVFAVDFRSVPRLGLPSGEVSASDPSSLRLDTPTFGLLGPGGALPRHHTATVGAELRKRSTALHSFLDMLARRFTAMWIKAGAKYRPTRNPEPAERVLAAAIGLGTPNLAPRIAAPLPALLYHAGHLASRTRSAERLRAMLAEEAGCNVEIIEFAGGWLRIPESEQTRMLAPQLGRGGGRLGLDAVAGAQVWDPQARFIIRLGPIADMAQFARLLPGQRLHQRLADLTRLFVGPEQDFVFNPVLAAAAVPALSLGSAGGGRMGWTTWLGTPRPRRQDAADALLRSAV